MLTPAASIFKVAFGRVASIGLSKALPSPCSLWMGLSFFGCGCFGLLGARPPCTDSTQVKSFSTSASLIHVAIHSLHPSCIRVWYSQHARLELKWLWFPHPGFCLLSSLASLMSCRVSHVIHSCMSQTRSRIPSSRHLPVS